MSTPELLRVIAAFEAQDDAELSVKPSDIVTPLPPAEGDEPAAPGWVLVALVLHGDGSAPRGAARSGYVPESYVEAMEVPESVITSPVQRSQQRHAATTGTAAASRGSSNSRSVSPAATAAVTPPQPPAPAAAAAPGSSDMRTMHGAWTRVLFSFAPQAQGEIPVQQGDIVLVAADQSKAPQGWLLVQKEVSWCTGLLATPRSKQLCVPHVALPHATD